MDGLEPVGMRFEERLPTRRVECDALDVAAAPLVDNRHSASFVGICWTHSQARIIRDKPARAFAGPTELCVD
jgi:hypothetical protein